MKRTSRRQEITESSATPWWLGEEMTCVFCLHGYAYEMRVHCVACDQAICAECVVLLRETNEYLCPECAKENGG